CFSSFFLSFSNERANFFGCAVHLCLVSIKFKLPFFSFIIEADDRIYEGWISEIPDREFSLYCFGVLSKRLYLQHFNNVFERKDKGTAKRKEQRRIGEYVYGFKGLIV